MSLARSFDVLDVYREGFGGVGCRRINVAATARRLARSVEAELHSRACEPADVVVCRRLSPDDADVAPEAASSILKSQRGIELAHATEVAAMLADAIGERCLDGLKGGPLRVAGTMLDTSLPPYSSDWPYYPEHISGDAQLVVRDARDIAPVYAKFSQIGMPSAFDATKPFSEQGFFRQNPNGRFSGAVATLAATRDALDTLAAMPTPAGSNARSLVAQASEMRSLINGAIGDTSVAVVPGAVVPPSGVGARERRFVTVRIGASTSDELFGGPPRAC